MSNGYVFVTGSSYTNRTQADYMTAKYGPEGEVVWLRRAGTEVAGVPQMDEPVDVHADAAGSGYVTGRGENDTMITVKYSEAGNEEWRARANGRAVAVAVDGAGNVYVGGDRTSIGHPNRDVIVTLVHVFP